MTRRRPARRTLQAQDGGGAGGGEGEGSGAAALPAGPGRYRAAPGAGTRRGGGAANREGGAPGLPFAFFTSETAPPRPQGRSPRRTSRRRTGPRCCPRSSGLPPRWLSPRIPAGKARWCRSRCRSGGGAARCGAVRWDGHCRGQRRPRAPPGSGEAQPRSQLCFPGRSCPAAQRELLPLPSGWRLRGTDRWRARLGSTGRVPWRCSRGDAPREALPARRSSPSAGMGQGGRSNPTGRGFFGGALQFQSGNALRAPRWPQRGLRALSRPTPGFLRAGAAGSVGNRGDPCALPAAAGQLSELSRFALSGVCCCVAAQISSRCRAFIPSEWELCTPAPLSRPRLLVRCSRRNSCAPGMPWYLLLLCLDEFIFPNAPFSLKSLRDNKTLSIS